MVLVAVEAMTAGSRSSVSNDSMCTSTGGRCSFGTSAPSLTKASRMHFSGAKEGSATLPKLAKLFGPSSTLLAKELFLICSACSAAAAPSVRLRIFLSASTSASAARRGCRA